MSQSFDSVHAALASLSVRRLIWIFGVGILASCQADAPPELEALIPALAMGSDDYCAVSDLAVDVLADRPGADAPPVDDVNWFARPVPHDGTDWIIAF
ncbi:MAG: hypothetical protein O2956_14695, partial [Gemmatimonadetes bacterium]|nr:hypothetical protein [Gemmatimonadota bacterium]